MVRSRFGRVVAVLDKVKCDLAGDANEYTPIYRLPDDILVEVWDYLSVDDRIHLTSISKRWRRVALHTPKLWKYIHISPHVDSRRIASLLSRTRDAPLHIALDNNAHPPYNRFPYSPWRGWGASIPLPIHFDHVGPYPTLPVDFSPHLEIANNVIGRAVVLQASVQIPQRRSYPGTLGALSIDSLLVPMPWLQSLRLSGPSSRHRAAQTTHHLSLFSQTTPRLRHVDFTSFHAAWYDPIYSNLTYIKIRRPYSLCNTKTLHTILQRCPSLTDLHLDSVFVDNDESSLPAALLPALRACVIRDKHALSILAILRCLLVPQLSHLDIATVDYSIMNQLSVTDAPFVDFREVVEVDIPNDFSTSSVIRFRLGTPKGLIIHQVDYELDDTTRQLHPTWEIQQTNLLDQITRTPLAFEKVVTLKISPSMSRTFIERLFELFPLIKTLELSGSSVQHDHSNQNGDSNFSLLHVLGTRYCTHLAEMRIFVYPEYRSFEILDFLSLRATQVDGCRRLGLLVVFSTTRLRIAMHTLMASTVDRLVWKQAKAHHSYGLRRLTPVPPPDVDGTMENTVQDFAPWDEGDPTPALSRSSYVDPSGSYFSFPA